MRVLKDKDVEHEALTAKDTGSEINVNNSRRMDDMNQAPYPGKCLPRFKKKIVSILFTTFLCLIILLIVTVLSVVLYNVKNNNDLNKNNNKNSRQNERKSNNYISRIPHGDAENSNVSADNYHFPNTNATGNSFNCLHVVQHRFS